LGPSIVYSERTNEELEELFRTIIDDKEFLNICQQDLKQQDKFDNDDLTSLLFSTNKFDYDEIPTIDSGTASKPEIVHEINMSVYYDFQINRENSDLKFIKRYINIIPEQNESLTKKNRFSNLNLPNHIDRCVKMHDYVHHSQQQQETKIPKQEVIQNKKPSIRRRQTMIDPKRRSTITTTDAEEFDPDALAQIVEQQLEAARRAAAAKQFTPIVNQTPRTQPVNRVKFVQPPILIPKVKEQPPRHRVDDIEFPKRNINRLLRRPLTFIDNIPISSKNEREKLLLLGQQGIISSAAALGAQKIPDNVKVIELLEIPNTKKTGDQYQDFRLIHYETVDNSPLATTPLIRRAKSMKNVNNQPETSNRRASTVITDTISDKASKLTSPLKSIKRNIHHKRETDIHNQQVLKEKSKGKNIVEIKQWGNWINIRNDDYCCC
jgi:hypothetical protein